MNEEYDNLPKINRNDLLKTKKYRQLFLPLFITDDMYHNHREIMPKLNSSQQTYLTFYLIDESMRIGDNRGFFQLMYDGYGEYVFEKPFAKIIKTWGAIKISEIVEKARSLYEKHKNRVEKNNTNEFAIIDESNSQVSHVDISIKEMDDRMKMFGEIEIIEKYIEDNISKFTIIDENNTFVINTSEIFGENNVLISSITKNINGKRITIKVEKEK